MKVQVVKIGEIKTNPNNPRVIKDDKFEKLVKSIKEFPQMLSLRPIIVNDDMIVLGGNMRLKACKEAGMTSVPIIKAGDLTEAQQREFIIKDNVGFGDWDWEMLANQWDSEELTDWGLDVWNKSGDVNLDEFFKPEQDQSIQDSTKIILEYTKEDYDLVIDAFKNHSGTKEEIVAKLLGV